MKRLALIALAAIALAAVADIAIVAPPASVTNETVSITAPRGMQGWCEIDIAATALTTNAPAVYAAQTYFTAGTNTTLVALCAPLTNAAEVAVMRFPAMAVGTNIVFTTTSVSNVVRSAILRYTPTYPR